MTFEVESFEQVEIFRIDTFRDPNAPPVSDVPEPATISLFGAALLAAAACRRRARKKREKGDGARFRGDFAENPPGFNDLARFHT